MSEETFNTTVLTPGHYTSDATGATISKETFNSTVLTPEYNASDNIDHDRLLKEYNDNMAREMIPAMAYLVILMIFGIIGNTAVCYYYGCNARRTTGSLFIIMLSTYDLLLCIFCIPIEILDIRFFYTFTYGGACKFMRFVNYFASAGSVFMLQVIAVDRYRRICRPLKRQIGSRGAKIACTMSVFAGVFFSWASFIFFDAEPVEIVTPEGIVLKGHDCTTRRDKSFQVYIWVLIGVFVIGILVSAVILFVMYGIAGWTLRKQARKSSKLHDAGNKDQGTGGKLEMHKLDYEGVSVEGKISQKAPIIAESHKTQHDDNLSKASVRFTYMMLTISAVFFLSFVPFIGFAVWRGTLKEYEGDDFTTGQQIALNIGIRSFFLNSAINPFIYGFFNPKFRSLFVRCKEKWTKSPDNSTTGNSTQSSKAESSSSKH